MPLFRADRDIGISLQGSLVFADWFGAEPCSGHSAVLARLACSRLFWTSFGLPVSWRSRSRHPVPEVVDPKVRHARSLQGRPVRTPDPRCGDGDAIVILEPAGLASSCDCRHAGGVRAPGGGGVDHGRGRGCCDDLQLRRLVLGRPDVAELPRIPPWRACRRRHAPSAHRQACRTLGGGGVPGRHFQVLRRERCVLSAPTAGS
jgi:hypothetical protein